MTTGSKIESIGIKLPEKIVSTAEIIHKLKLSKPVQLERLTGISNRHICSENEDSLTLAVEATLDCLKYSAYKAEDIEMIICCSISKYVNGLNHVYEPALSLLIRQKLGNKKALFFDISNACAGMMTGVFIANNYISCGIVKNCLVVSGEYISSLCTNAIHNINKQNHPEMASLTVGDAGAAVILDKAESDDDKFLVLEMNTLSQYSNLCMGFQSTRQPGGVMKTQMKKIHDVSIKNAPFAIEKALGKAGLKMSGIDFLIPHQTAKRSIQSGAAELANYFLEKPGETVVNIAETGNTASTTHFVTIYKYLQENRFKKGNKIMLLGFASGLVIGIIVFKINRLIESYGNYH
jgi:3-oxoacyl-[acyl-carrier-protein] synthase III